MQVFWLTAKNDQGAMARRAKRKHAVGGLPKPQLRVKMELERTFENCLFPA